MTTGESCAHCVLLSEGMLLALGHCVLLSPPSLSVGVQSWLFVSPCTGTSASSSWCGCVSAGLCATSTVLW